MLCIDTQRERERQVNASQKSTDRKKEMKLMKVMYTYIDAYKATNQDNLQHLKELQFNTKISMSSSQSLGKRQR